MGNHRRSADVLVRPASGSHRAIPGPRSARPGRPAPGALRATAVPTGVGGFPAVPAPRAAVDPVAACPTDVLEAGVLTDTDAAAPPDLDTEFDAGLDADTGAHPEAAAQVLPEPAGRRPGGRPAGRRRPALLLAALVAGALGAGVLGLPGAPDAAAEGTAVLDAQMELATGDEAVEVMPMASITEAEAQARLQEVAASRAQRAAAEAAAAEAAAEAARPKYVLPVAGARFTSGYGGRWGTFHYGIDLAAPMRTPEMAAADGVVVRAGAASGFGLAVYVLHENGDVTVYGHMDEILVEPGQYVEAGETIALLGNRGQSTGPHLHFEVHEGGMNGTRIDPVPWLAERGVEV
ncbi:Peptidase family M23 [Geodermatophilus telluris]|uniref:Peptidase family M23 n=1 Tax=Geodermatophilus telluris TaxID=1190417 RepID=A0A1G6MQT8_9ACTN|nr:M23 family metallopeptidase [Geodermatophilus telluris]SDC57923.1 Peptidase family M23 [Geodermatophilus telluris]